MLSVRESLSGAELERMHTGRGALPHAAEYVERADAPFVQKEKTSSGGTASSDDDVELTVRGDDASSDSDDETIELSPQVTVRGSVAGHTGPSAIATSSYYDLSATASGPSMSVTSRWVEQQRERSPPVRSAFSATGLPTVAYDRTVSPNSLRCDEEVARISAAAASPPRPRTSSVPDSPSRCYVNMPVGGVTASFTPPAFGVWPHVPSHMSSRAQSRAPSQMSGLDVTGLLNRLVDRQHDDFQRAVQREQSASAEAYQREKEARAESKAEAVQRERKPKLKRKLKPLSENKQPKLKQRLKC